MEDQEDGNNSKNVSGLAAFSSSHAISIESDSSTRSGNSTVSLFSVLKARDMPERPPK